MIKRVLALSVVFVFGLAACSSHQASGPKADLLELQKKLTESEEKIDKLTQRVTLIQIIVDSHQRALQDLADGATAGDPDAETAPAPLVPGPEATPDASQAHPVPETVPSEPSPEPVEIEETQPAETEAAPPISETASPESFPESSPAPRGIEETQQIETDDRLIVPGPNPEYQKAMEIFRGGDYETADGMFENFVRQFPDDDLADNALYWSGECRYARKDYSGALEQFRKVIDNYPSGSKVPDALLKIGFSHLSLGDKESAVTYLKKVVSQYPFSTAGTKAEERLNTLQR